MLWRPLSEQQGLLYKTQQLRLKEKNAHGLLWFGGFAECRGQNGKKEGVMGIEKMEQEVGEEERPGPW